MITPNPTAILMLSYASKFHTGENSFQQFWKYRYDTEPYELLNWLYNNDFIELDSIDNSLKHKTVNELKTILSNNNLKISGKKDDLINRISSTLNEEQISQYIPERYYRLTQFGNEILNNNPNVAFIHKHPEFDLTIYEVPPSGNIYDFILNKISERESEYIYYNNWGLYRNCKSQRAQLAKLQGDTISAISYLIEVCYIDISGLRNGVEPQKLYDIKEHIGEWGDPTKMLAQGNIELINTLSKEIGLTYDDMSTMCHSIIDKTNLPFRLYNDTDATNIILQRIYGTVRMSYPTIAPSSAKTNHIIGNIENMTSTKPIYPSPVKSDKKLFCPSCKGTFINRNVCPDCGCNLINEHKENIKYSNNEDSKGNGYGCLMLIAIFIFLMLLFWGLTR